MILLRHTRPAVAPGICYGSTDLDCADGFEVDAALIATALPLVDRIVTSPLRRCRRLADALGAERGLPVEIDARLAEMDFGGWEGLAWDAVPRAEVDAWAADLHGYRPGGGEGVTALAARVGAALVDYGGGETLLVTHMGVIRAALAWAGNPGAWQATLPYGGRITI